MQALQTIAQLSKLLEVCKTFLRKEVHEGRLKAYYVGKGFRFKKEDVEDYINNSRYRIDERKANDSKSVQTKLWD